MTRHRFEVWRSLWAMAPITLGFAVGVARAEPATGVPDEAARQDPEPPPSDSPADPMQRIGSISIGRPNAGYLVNGVRMPEGKEWVIGVPDHAWGTDETIEALVKCIRSVAAEFPNTPPAILGSISAQHGGPLPPHKSHRTGRDVDINLYLTKRKPKQWYEVATADNLDRARTWALIRALVTQSDVELILLDQSLQDLLEEHALAIGEDRDWVRDLFHDERPYSALIRHVPGHTGHMHVRFVSQYSRRRGVELYDQLVAQGHITPPVHEVVHEVVRGDTLLGLARKYQTTVPAIQAANGLDTVTIKVGQKLTMKERVDIPGAHETVRVPPRRLPPSKDLGAELAAAAGRLEVHATRSPLPRKAGTGTTTREP